MRRVHRFTAFAAVILATSLALAAPASLKPPEKDRLRTQIEVFAKDIGQQPKERKLLYMVLMLQARDYTKVAEFYEGLAKEGQDDLFVQMAYVQAQIAREEYGTASGVLNALARKHTCNRLKAQVAFLRGMDLLKETSGVNVACRTAIKWDPTYTPAYYRLGEDFELNGKYHAEAIGYYAQALSLEQPDSDLARKVRKNLLEELEAHPDAAPK